MKKKLLLSVLCLLVAIGAFALKGDVNGDGSITSADITALYTKKSSLKASHTHFNWHI